MELKKPWDDGGSLSVTYDGYGDGSAVFSSEENEGIDREVSVFFKGGGLSIERSVKQEGLREEILAADGLTFKSSDGYFGVLKKTKQLPYLAFEALEDGLTFSMTNSTIQYSLNGKSWISLPAGTTSTPINTGEKVYLKATGLTATSSSGIGRFIFNKKCNLSGTPMSLIYGDEFDKYLSLAGYNYALRQLFYGCSKIISISDDFLPATTLSSACYYGMFMGCTSLEYAPELPAMTVGASEYRCMFQNCTSLKEAPELPAMTLGSACYYDMFNGCTSLESEITLPATTLTADCYGRMFQNCRSLTKVFLPATKITARCYQQMFSGCTSLNHITALFETEPSDTYTKEWVANVSPNGVFVKSVNATWNVVGVNGVPEGWVVKRNN